MNYIIDINGDENDYVCVWGFCCKIMLCNFQRAVEMHGSYMIGYKGMTKNSKSSAAFGLIKELAM